MCAVSPIHVVGQKKMRTAALVYRQWLFRKPGPNAKAKVLATQVERIAVIKMDILLLLLLLMMLLTLLPLLLLTSFLQPEINRKACQFLPLWPGNL